MKNVALGGMVVSAAIFAGTYEAAPTVGLSFGVAALALGWLALETV